MLFMAIRAQSAMKGKPSIFLNQGSIILYSKVNYPWQKRLNVGELKKCSPLSEKLDVTKIQARL